MTQTMQEQEAQRLTELAEYNLDRSHDEAFYGLAKLAAAICGTPIGLVSIVDAETQWSKAAFGIAAGEAPRGLSFCQHAILAPDLLVVPDTLEDVRFAQNPFVVGDPRARFYAGAPLRAPSGHTFGTLCVLDRRPRDLSPDQQEALRILARQTVAQLELRQQKARLEQEVERRRRAERVLQNKHIAAAVLDNAASLIVVLDRAGRIVQFNRAAEQLTGWRADAADGQPFWRVMVRPEEAGQFEVLFRQLDLSAFPLAYESQLPTLDGELRTISWRVSALCQLGELAYLVCAGTDLTERIRSEEQRTRAEAEHIRLQEQVIAAQAAALAELSTPLIPISDSVVVMPLIGAIDSGRARQVVDSLLRGIEQRRARTAILDITGVPVVDTRVADALIQAAQSTTLLGARVVLTGIRPEIAQTLVGLGVDLRQVATRATLQAGIQYATTELV
ncbi:MAG TPA: STAS domain-containing protein [Roseiflexaceae bacterium]|nr:STAS domain-containing protein [Roseiflexaceae bacterium]